MQGTLRYPLVGCKFCDMPLLGGDSDTCNHCASLEAPNNRAGVFSAFRLPSFSGQRLNIKRLAVLVLLGFFVLPAFAGVPSPKERCEDKAALMLHVTWNKGQGKSRREVLAGQTPATLTEAEHNTLVRRYWRTVIPPTSRRSDMNLLELASRRHDQVLRQCLTNLTS